MPLLRFDRHRRDGACLQAAQADRLSSDFAIAIFAFVEAAERGIDLGDQLALAIAGAQFDRPVGFALSAIGQIGFAQRINLQLRQGSLRLPLDRVLPV